MAAVGFIGLGSMGQAMASRLVEAGHDVLVWNRSPEPVQKLVELGAVAASSPAEALSTGMSFSMLANDHAAENVLSSGNFQAGAGVHANMASVSPDCAARISEIAQSAGISYLAAPVLGRPPVAAAGKLNILAAGPSQALEQAEPFFSLMGVRTWPLGDIPHIANVVKVAVNYNIIHALEALSESIAMVEGYGVDAEGFVELLTSTLFGGVVYQGYGNLIAKREYLPAGFTLELGLKDLGLAESTAAAVGSPLPTAPAIRAVFEKALADKTLEGHDWAAIAEIIRAKTRSSE
jgi:3-hydroxyisobutyrate dehydrogenase-like beta-hydroxyacid dehydrogenase